MTTHLTPRQMYGQIQQYTRAANNGQIPQAGALHTAAYALSQYGWYAGKCFFVKSENLLAVPNPTSAARSLWNAFGRTGEGRTAIRHYIGTTALTNAGASDPYIYVIQTPTGGGASNSTELHTGFAGTGTGLVLPSEVHHGEIRQTVAANTEYSWSLESAGYGRPVYWIIVETAQGSSFDDSTTGFASPAPYVVEAPIYDSSVQDVLEAGTKLLRHNAPHLLAWTARATASGVSAPTRTSATYAESTAMSEYVTPVQYHRTRMSTTVPVTFAAFASTSSGSTNGVRLVDADSGTQLIEITGFTTTTTWRSTAGSIPATTRAVKVQFKSDGSATLTLNAVSAFEYET